MRTRRTISVIILLAAVFAAGLIAGRAAADSSPKISNVVIAPQSSTSTVVTWTTDRKTDSFIYFSEDTNYCGIRNSGDLTTDHSVTIPNLTPNITYFLRIRATDVGSNQSFSGDYTFSTTSTASTPGLAAVQNTEQRNLAAQAVATIQQITNPAALQAVAQAVNTQAEANVGPPKIIGNPKVDVGSDQATVTWNTDQNADGTVSFATDAEYAASGNYTREESDPNSGATTHTVILAGLTPSTVYHYKASSKGPIGAAGESGDLTFMTKSILPEILNPHLVTVSEHAATINWATPFPTAGRVEYTNMSTRKTLSAGDPTFLVTHSIQLNNLLFQTRYSVVVQAINQASDTVSSQPLYFVTTKRLVPPVISQVNNDSTLYPGQDTKVQTIVSWQTDEPSSCMLSYVPGIVKDVKSTISTPAEDGFLTRHVSVVTDFVPATVYKYWVTCTDADTNTTSSEDFVLLTPQQQKSIIDIIVANFKTTFGWLNDLGGAGAAPGH